MLRTFCSNPTLGGFGSESTTLHSIVSEDNQTPDAFCQIIKELVDNAVDACNVSMVGKDNCTNSQKLSVKNKKAQRKTKKNISAEMIPTKRVRVVIEPFTDRHVHSSMSSSNNYEKRELLRVTVSDNGCGMNDIQACVGAFHSSKAHNNRTKRASKSNDNFATNEMHTVGRYGIGLTLCLLHAQRLVPDSCASLQSAVSSDKEWKLVTAVVDTDLDRVQCFPRDGIPKSMPTESGTSISILVPGGSSAVLAWPRLAEYFARFKLSLGMTCSLEVLAPTLSRVPLWVQPNSQENPMVHVDSKSLDGSSMLDNSSAEMQYKDDCSDHFDLWEESSGLGGIVMRNHDKNQSSFEEEMSTSHSDRIQIWNAVKSFLGRSINLANVSHAAVPIRIEGDISEKFNSKNRNALWLGPQLIVDLIVHDAKVQDEECVVDESTGEFLKEAGNLTADNQVYLEDSCSDVNKPASMVLIRMVNKIPLLDSAEAVACGLVQCLASKKRMWNSFGLDVHLNIDPANTSSVPTYDVRDSEQVIPFFKQGAHNLLEGYDDDENVENFENSHDELDSQLHVTGDKRPKRPNRRNMLPAAVRLGSILVIVQIHAEPSMLPLPTLSKGRLPIGNKAIDDAFEIGITQCLQQLQKTNPNLLLTASELRKAECDARFVPAVSLALASILSQSTLIESQQYIDSIQEWKDRSKAIPSNLVACSSSDDASYLSSHNRDGAELSFTKKRDDVQALGLVIERRLRSVLSCSSKNTGIMEETYCMSNDKPDYNSKSCNPLPSENINSVSLLNRKKKSKRSQYIHGEKSDKKANEHMDREYRDFDEWF